MGVARGEESEAQVLKRAKVEQRCRKVKELRLLSTDFLDRVMELVDYGRDKEKERQRKMTENLSREGREVSNLEATSLFLMSTRFFSDLSSKSVTKMESQAHRGKLIFLSLPPLFLFGENLASRMTRAYFRAQPRFGWPPSVLSFSSNFSFLPSPPTVMSQPLSPHPTLHSILPNKERGWFRPTLHSWTVSHHQGGETSAHYNSREVRKGRLPLRLHHHGDHGQTIPLRVRYGHEKTKWKPGLMKDISFWVAVLFWWGSAVWVVSSRSSSLPPFVQLERSTSSLSRNELS